MITLFGPRRFGLALGSGSARGLAHIGVLKVLEAEGLEPDVVTGTSMGAIVGAFHAAGYSAAEMEEIALENDVRSMVGLVDVAISKGAMLAGEKVEAFLREYLPPTFEELRKPFGCVAVDLTRDTAVAFTAGDLITAVRASISIPVVFLPVRMDGMLLVDGYVADPIPVRLTRQLGARVAVGVDVSGSGTVTLTDGVERGGGLVADVRAIMKGDPLPERGTDGADIIGAVSEGLERRLAEVSVRGADHVLRPEVSAISGFEFHRAPEAIEAGERAALAGLGRIRRLARRR